MAESDLRIKTYLRAFFADTLTLMSGSLSVPFVAVALWVSSRGQKILWGCLAVLSFVFAPYRVWRKERIEAAAQMDALRSEIADRDQKISDLSEELERLAEQYRARGSPVEYVIAELISEDGKKKYTPKLRLSIKEMHVNERMAPIARAVIRHELTPMSGMAIEDGNYSLFYTFDGKPLSEPVRIQGGKMLAR